ncbi:hypothetical protein J4208_01615 [Candidatus Woesearchaeota archaeon]|nr:hypothetical protein [Candidatus Woesearchaeota archaeon]
MSAILGFLAVLVSIFCWGSYFVPLKKIKNYDPFAMQILVGIGVFLSSLFVLVFHQGLVFSFWAFLAGLLWAAGNIIAVSALKHLDLSRAAPLWSAVFAISTFLWGILFFQELLGSLLLGILGVILLLTGVIALSSTGTTSKKTMTTQGILLTILAGLVWGVYMVPFKLSGLPPLDFLFPMSLGVLFVSLLIYLLKRPSLQKTILFKGALSGILWNIGNVVSFFAILALGIAVVGPLTQVNIFVHMAWGLFYFKEAVEKKERIKLILGSLVLFIGAIILGFTV